MTGLVKYMASGPVVAMVWEGKDVVKVRLPSIALLLADILQTDRPCHARSVALVALPR